MRSIEQVINRLRAEFVEMPGMQLTSRQVQRLCGLERGVCQAVLDSLVAAKFLCVSADGRYARVADAALPNTSARRDESLPALDR